MSNTMIRLKAAALVGAVAVGFVAFGDDYNEWTAAGGEGYWDASGSWTTIGEGNFVDWRIGNGPDLVGGGYTALSVKFSKAETTSDETPLYIYGLPTTFTADNATAGLTKQTLVLHPTWGWGGTLTIGVGTYTFNSIEANDAFTINNGTVATKYIWGGTKGSLTLNGGTLKFDSTEYDSNDWGIIGVPLTIGSSGGTIDTGSGENNYRLAVTSSLSGSGLITKTGARPLSFNGDISGFNGTITVAAGAGAVTVGETTIEEGQTVAFGNAYVWTGGAGVEDTSWSNGENWRTGTAPNDGEAEVLIPDGAVITLTADATVGTVTINGTVTLTTNDYFLRSNKIIAGENGLLVLSNAKLAGISANSEISVALDIQTGTTNELYTANAGGQNGYPINVTSNISGDGKLIINAYASGGGDSNVNAGISLVGDNSAFSGTMEYRLGQTNSGKYQARQRDVLVASASSEDADWLFYMNYQDEPLRNSGLLFPTENGEYKFGSARINLPQSAYTVANGVSFVIGKKNTDSFIKGTWGKSVSVEWIASTATLTNNAANTGSISLTGGGNLALSASGIPAAINFSEEGGCLVLSDDDDLNARVLAAVSTVADGASIGFVYDGEAVKTLDLSGKKTLLAGKSIVKRGTGTVYLTGLAGVTLGDVTVEEGTLALQHGAKVGTVTVEDGAEFYVDLTGAVDREVVFEYDSGDVGENDYRNLAEGAAVTIDDSGETTVWTLSREAKRYTWTGAVSTDYADSGNWDPAGHPTTDDTVVFTGDATLKPGAVFGSIEFQNDAKISFDFTLGKVGASTTLITLTRPDSDTSSHFVYPGANYISNFSGGVFATTRNATTYTWTGSVDNSWATSGNWTVDATEVREVPEPEDSVIFPASDAEGFKNWEVTLPWDVYAETVWVNGNTLLSGARTLKAHTINGAAELRLNNAHLGSNGEVLDVYCPLNIMPNTTNYIYLQKFGNNAGNAYIVNLRGPLYGSGVLKADHAGVQGVGVKFYGNNSGFYGTFESSNYNQRDATDMENSTSSSANAIWNVYTYNNNSDQALIVHGTDTYYFGALNGGLQMGSAGGSKSPNETVSIEVGARDDVPSSFALASHVNYNKGYDVRKVGNNKMSITGKGWAGGNNVFRLNSLAIAGGTAYIPSLPNEFITFEGKGGILQLGYETKSEEVEVTPAVTDPQTGAVTPAQTETVYTYPLYDPSALVKNSSGEFGYDDLGTNSTWESAIAASNVGGFAKYGAGTLTLKAWDSNFEGVVTVWDGTLIVPEGTELVVNPLSAGVITYPNGGDPIDRYCYAPGTVLNGTETADDDLDKQLDVANVVKVDFSNPTEEMLADLCDDGIFVLAKTSDSSSLPVVGYEKNAIELDMLGEDYEWPAGVEKPKWWNESTKWTVRVLTVKENGTKYTALAVARGEFPFVISVQ